MNQDRRRLLCRVSFILFACVPTIIVFGWLVWPEKQTPWADTATRTLGWDVSVGTIMPTRGQSTSLVDVSVYDDRAGQVCALKELTVVESHSKLSLIADHLELDWDLARPFCEDLVRRFSTRETTESTELRLILHRLTIRELASSSTSDESAKHSPAFTFEDVELTWRRDDERTTVNLALRPAGAQESERLTLDLKWPTSSQGESTVDWILQTGEHPFPCQLAGAWFPFVDVLGEGATFRGRIRGVATKDSWSLEANGDLADVDLYELVTLPLHQTLTGEADVALSRLRVEDGRIVEAAGRLECPGGQVGRDLAQGGQAHFGWRQLDHPNDWPCEFTQLSIGFRTDGQWIEVHGLPDDRVIARNGEGDVWLVEANQPVVSTAAIIRLLSSGSDVDVPVTRETAALVRLFPIRSQRNSEPSSTGTSRLRVE